MPVDNLTKVSKKQWSIYILISLVSLTYVLLTFFAPMGENTLNFSKAQLLLLELSILIPYLATWGFAAYGLTTLEGYIESAQVEDTSLLSLLTSFRNGLIWIISGTIIVALFGAMKPYFPTNDSTSAYFTIITNYLYVFPPLVGFTYIYKGVVRQHTSHEASMHDGVNYAFNTIIVVLIAACYIFMIYTNPSRQFSSDPAVPATYYLPDNIIAVTIVIPIIITWWLGFSAAFTLSDLVPHLTRTEFFKGISRILYGIWAIIFTSIIIQALLSLGSARLYAFGLTILLAIIYIFILLQGLGYFFIAFGSNALQKSLKETPNK